MRNNQMGDQAQQVVTSICDLALVIGKFQNQLQAIREVLTLRADFNPQNLFNHISLGEEEITRHHILWFMEDNDRSITDEEAKFLFSTYGYKDKVSYSDFLNYVFPFDSETLRTISTVNCKKYMKTEVEKVTEQIRCIFVLLIQKQVEFLHYFQDAKSQTFPNNNRQTIKKAIKNMKRLLPLTFQMGIQSDFVLTFKEFKAILKKQKNIPERKAQPICRRLSLQKDSFIGVDQLQIWLKPWHKLQPQESPVIAHHQTLFDDIEQSRTIEPESKIQTA